VHGIFVIDEAGIVRASVGFENLRGEAALFGGALSAIQLFVKEISGNEVRELTFGETRLLIGKAGTDYIVTLHSLSEEDAESSNRAVQKLIQERRTPVDDGSLSLILSMMAVGREVSEKGRLKLDESDESTWGKTRPSTKDGRKKVI